MPAATDKSWMPSSEVEYKLDLGGSFKRAIKARHGQASSSRISKDFFSFRYSFKPESSASLWSGTMEVKKGAGDDMVTLEHSSNAPGEAHIFSGPLKHAKDKECVLIYDEERGTITLEKLDSIITASYSHKAFASDPGVPISATKSSPPPAVGYDAADELERELLGMREDIERDDIKPPASEVITHRPPSIAYQEEEEASEGEILPSPPSANRNLAPTPTSNPGATIASRKAATQLSAKSSQKVAQPPAKPVPPPAKSKQPPVKPAPTTAVPKPKLKLKAPKREREPAPLASAPFATSVTEERLEFGQSSRPKKRPRSSSPPPARQEVPVLSLPTDTGLSLPGEYGLSLPGSSTGLSLPGLPPYVPVPASATSTSAPVDATLLDLDTEDDDEDEDLWNEVIPPTTEVEPSPPRRFFEIEEVGVEGGPGYDDEENENEEDEEFDESAFAAAMDEHLQGEDEVSQSPMIEQRGPPMSMGQYTEQQVSDEDDDTDSDEDSDDD